MFLQKQKGYSCRQIAAKFQISKSSVSRILKEEKVRKDNQTKASKRRGRPCVLTCRDQRKFSRSVSQLRLIDPNFTAMDVVENNAIDCTKAKYRTFVSYFNKLGYKFHQTRKKGRLSEKDHNQSLKYARAASRLSSSYWTNDVAFYLDGVFFIHKINALREAITPRGRLRSFLNS